MYFILNTQRQLFLQKNRSEQAELRLDEVGNEMHQENDDDATFFKFNTFEQRLSAVVTVFLSLLTVTTVTA
jgi:hypothetical protein